MANLPGTLWATAGGAGALDGTSLANAAVVDPDDPNDIWTIINAGTVAEPVTVKLCGSAEIILAASININKDATAAWPISVVGRNATDTADAQLPLDANNEAFSVITLTAADYWRWERITACNTDENAGNYGWDVTADADYNTWLDCVADHCYRGWQFAAGAVYGKLHRCLSSNHAHAGYYSVTTSNHVALVNCIADNNGTDGYSGADHLTRCVAANNSDTGYEICLDLVNCTAYANANGFHIGPAGGLIGRSFLTNFVAVGHSGHGVIADEGMTQLINYAHYNNTGGAIDGTSYEAENTIAMTADPFVDAANGDFAINNAVAGGGMIRGIAHVSPDDNFTAYLDGGAVQHRSGPLVHPGMTGGING